MLETVLGVAAPMVFLVRLVPQPLRLARTGVDDGLSPMGAFNQLLSEGAWLAYGLIQASVSIWLVSAVALFPSGWQALMLVRRSRTIDLVGAAAFGAAIIVAWSAGWLGAILGASVLVTTGPQVFEALRRDDLSGIATQTWWIALVDAALWGSLGWVTDDLALVGYWAVLTVCALTVLARVAWTRRTRRGVA
ncbi:MAG: hypothetical protein V9E94_02300 [Microthrixaceae bacterium]